MADPGPDATRVRRSVLHVLARVAGGARAAVALDRALRETTSGHDRAFLTDLVYGTLRWLPALDAALAPRLRDPDALPPVVRWALRAGTYERGVRATPAHAAVHAWVEVVKRERGAARGLAGLVNAVLRRVDLEDAVAGPAGAALALPPALHRHLEAALGPDLAAAAARAMLVPGPVWLTALRPDAVVALEAEGAQVRPGPLPGSWSVRPGRPLGDLAAFREGFVQPQNPSSAAVVAALGEVGGRRVLDVGSGHGVKAAQLASAGAKVIAVERDPRRAATGRANLARLGLSAEHVVADATEALDQVAPVDVALLDAPCTGTGTLRGHPEIKLRWTPAGLAEASARQAAMLRRVAARVRPGGRLVYAVCALGREEAEDVIDGFLDEAAVWRAEPPSLPLATHPASVGARILPDDTGLDGFYVASLRRAPAPNVRVRGR